MQGQPTPGYCCGHQCNYNRSTGCSEESAGFGLDTGETPKQISEACSVAKKAAATTDRNDQDRQGPAQQLPTPAADSKMQAQPRPLGQEQVLAGQGPVEQARRAVIEEHSPVDSSSSFSDLGSPSTSECIAPIALK
ncbi:hypothetical protein Salat_2157600 [Sesamum alatum]|uniref:Uncharacterized protein n=1 Tax=Sesamum alatum TaxID=300844 RepID=A0AAE1Y2J2_9LAMI|nr:hypothetical protein Salat_2157600 [Sesamum alatum]